MEGENDLYKYFRKAEITASTLLNCLVKMNIANPS